MEKRGKVKTGNILAIVGVVAVLTGVYYGRSLVLAGKLGGKATESVVPMKVDVPVAQDVAHETTAQAALPTAEPGCPDKLEVRKLVMAWNAQMGEMFAAGGPQATRGSLLCEHGINYKVARQDDCGKMADEIFNFAEALAAGQAQPKTGVHFVAVMGDGAGAYLAALNQRLGKLGPDYKAEIVGSAGYSRGEDQFMGPEAWSKNPQTARGGVVSGVLRDGDWNIALKWAGDNDLCNNPDETTYDPDCLNWVGVNDFLDAPEKYINGYCEERPVVTKGLRTGKKQKICVQATVTWTPGDVNVAEKKGGITTIVSTRTYTGQMPNAIIGIKKWDAGNRQTVESMLEAIFAGADQVRQFPEALVRAGEASAKVYGDKDGAYWVRYYRGVTMADARGLEVHLGGSKVNNLADNLALFGLLPGRRNAFADTYTAFGKIVVEQYPKLVPTIPAAADVINTSFVEALARKLPKAATAAAAETPTFEQSDAGKHEISRRSWRFEFDYGKASFKPSSTTELEALARDLSVAANTIVKIDGYTDSRGDRDKNQALSEARSFAVRDYLGASAPASFPVSRFRVAGHGPENPIATNATDGGRAKNRRVEISIVER